MVPTTVVFFLFWAILVAQVAQLAIYWRRMPDLIAVHYDVTGEPSLYCPKALFYLLWVLFVTVTAFISYKSNPGVPLIFGAATHLFLLLIMQLVFTANTRGGRISILWVLLLIGAFVLLAVWTKSMMAKT